MKHHFLALFAFMIVSGVLMAQGDRKDKTAVTYEEIYDEPYSVNKLFVQIQPLYGELFVTNVNAGFGLEASYYHQDKLDIRAAFRKTYSKGFYDFNRDLASKNSQVDNRSQIYNYFEIGGTYHVKDFESSSKTKMFLYKNSYKGGKWSARVPLNAEIPCKVRKIYGVRLGGILWNSTADLSRTMEAQGLTNNDLLDAEGNPLPIEYTNAEGTVVPINVYSNIASLGGYLGGSISWFRNVAVNFDKFEEGIDDTMVTLFFDILISPSLQLDDVYYTDKDVNSPQPATQRIYSVDPIRTKMFGFRAGIDGKFNRTWGWAYGGEIGYRPSLETRGFFAMIKISFPVYGTNLDYKVESFGK